MLVSHSINPENLVTIAQILTKILKLSHSVNTLSDVWGLLADYVSSPWRLKVEGEQGVQYGYKSLKLASTLGHKNLTRSMFLCGQCFYEDKVLERLMFSHGWCLRCHRECCLLEQFMFQLGQCFFFVFSEKVGGLDGLSHFLGGSEKKYNKKIYV